MRLTLAVLAGAFVLITFIWLFRILFAHNTLRQARRQTGSTNQKTPVHIILPILNENRRLRSFISVYQDLKAQFPSIDLWLVTTEREKEIYPQSLTFSLAKKFSESDDSIQHVHFPGKHGVVAHQLNYALKRIPDSGFTVIYNADSVPDKKTFQWMLSQNADVPQVFQQYGVYDRNITYLLSRPFKNILAANAHWQTRWAFGIEYFKAAAGHKQRHRPTILRYFSYCISHGLFVTTPLIKKIGFSEKTINEDAIFGIEAGLLNVTVQPIPYFDFAESPDSLASIHGQKTNWFQGCFQAPLYFSLLSGKDKADVKLLVACAQFFAYSFYWILGPLFSLIIMVLAVICAFIHPVYALCALAPLFFLVVPTVLNQSLINQLGDNKVNLAKLFSQLLVGSMPAYFIHGAAGINGIFKSRYIMNGHKKKTHMSQDGES